MSEAMILEMLRDARDIAKTQGMLRLSEHLDDAMLIAASDAHARDVVIRNTRPHETLDPTVVRITPLGGVH